LFKFSIASAFRRRGIAVFAILGTALGIALMTVLLSISDGMDKVMNDTMNDLAGGIGVYSHDAPMGFMTGGGTPFSISYAQDIKEIDHVDTVRPEVLVFVPREVANFGDPMGVTLRGVDFTQDNSYFGPTSSENIKEGKLVQGQNEVVLGSMLAAFASGEHTKVGGKIVIPVVGGTPVTLNVVGIFETGNNIYDSSMYTNMATARDLVLGVSSGEVNFISVQVVSTEYVQDVADSIYAMFEHAQVPVKTVIATDMIEQINESMSVFHSFLWVVSLVAAIAGGVSIFIVMLISVIERTKEFGILKAAGWSNTNIIGSVIFQSLAVAILGAVVGLIIGYGAGVGIDRYLKYDVALITWTLALIVVGFGMVMGIVGGLYPAIRAARVSPIESLRAI